MQNPRRVTKLLSIASTHAQICQRIIKCSTSYALIASVELATKILCELVCTSRVAPRFLALDRVFRQQHLTRSFLLPGGAIKLAPLPEIYTYLCYPSPQRWPKITLKGISRNNFRPVRFYRTPHILNLAFIVKYTYVWYQVALGACRSRFSPDRQTDKPTTVTLASACARRGLLNKAQ